MATAKLSSDTVKKLAHAIHTTLAQGSVEAEEFAERVVTVFEGKEAVAEEAPSEPVDPESEEG